MSQQCFCCFLFVNSIISATHKTCNISNHIFFLNYTDYGSISVSNGSALEFSLGYNFFFDTRFQSASAPGQDRSHVLQTVNVSFTPASTNLSGLIFYSRTDATIQVMEVRDEGYYTT